MQPIARHWNGSPRLLAEHLVPIADATSFALAPGAEAPPAAVAARAARALLDLPAVAADPPPWLAPHQVPALNRLRAIIARYGGALLADAVGLGKSYIALAVALDRGEPLTLVLPAVLIPQWQRLLAEKGVEAGIVSHESLSRGGFHLTDPGRKPGAPGVLIVDEAHRFRNPETRRYRELAELCIGRRVLLVTATPVYNRIADLFHLFRLFLRDDALTALGVGSLARAARGEVEEAAMRHVVARMMIARSRRRVGSSMAFPRRAPQRVIRAGTAPPDVLRDLIRSITALRIAGQAAALLRLVLLRRLASSVPAFRETLERYHAFAEMADEARRSGRRLGAREFQHLFPREAPDLQLTFLPLVLDVGEASRIFDLQELIALLLRLTDPAPPDPKAQALSHLLRDRAKTIVFTEARASARYLLNYLAPDLRVAAVTGREGWFGRERASTHEVLSTFAPVAQGAPPPPPALETDVLIATDLASEGLNLQDAVRVIHYDLPWSPARLAQRAGRVDRLGSPHEVVSTIAFLPPPELGNAVGFEPRLVAKLLEQERAGTAQREPIMDEPQKHAPLDWCDRLQALASGAAAPVGAWVRTTGATDSAVLVVRIGEHLETVVVEAGTARADPERATRLLEHSVVAPVLPGNRAALDGALRVAMPVIRTRLAAVQAARWRAQDRDRLARRLIPWVLTAARRAARSGDAALLGRLDQLVNRLTLGMTAGEEFRLHALLERRASLMVRDALAWHESLPPVHASSDIHGIELIAAVTFSPCSPRFSSTSTAPSSIPSI